MATPLDRREQVLARLYTLLSELNIPLLGGASPATIVPGNIVANRNQLPEGLVPGIILLDGDEVNDRRKNRPERGLQEKRVPDQVMKMTPEIYVVLDTRGITNLNVGEDLNTARLAILAAILPDPTLQSIVGSDGDICLDGVVTDLARGRQMRGQLGMSISFCYPLIAGEYTGTPG
jgi:hypothetical protein